MGEYAEYIWAAYGFAFVVLSALSFHIWRDMRRQRLVLDDLEARGAPRRAAARASDAMPGEVS